MWTRAWGADEKTVRAWDGVMFFWVVFWLVVGCWTGYQIWQLTGLSASTVDSGRALQSAGQALKGMADTPLIGAKTGEIGNRVVATAGDIIDSGSRADRSIRGLSVLIGLAVGLAPTGPVLFFYLPKRLARRRDIAEISQALNDGSGGQALQTHLAHRAMSSLDYAQLRAVTADPRADLEGGHHEALASAELARLGLTPPARSRG